MQIWQWCKAWSSPQVFFHRAASWSRVLWPLAWICLLGGSIGGLLLVPSDAQQGETFRILYVHVPCAFFSMALYLAMLIASVVLLVFHIKIADAIAQSCAYLGAMVTALALLTGAIWGQPMWGTAWVWDARLTSELVLLFLYLGYIALRHALNNPEQARRGAAFLAIIGGIDLPIIHYSVKWWHTLHQGPTVLRAHPAIDPSMLWPLLCCLVGFLCYSLAWVLTHARSVVWQTCHSQQWVRALEGDLDA